MQTFTLPNGIVVDVHDSPRTIPESRRVEHDYYALIESGIGSTQDDFDRHFEQMIGLIGSTDPDAQLNAINNTRFLFANLIGKQYSPASLAFGCLVETVDGQKWDDYSEAGLERLSKQLDIPMSILIEYWEAVKKNSTKS
jgi:hypothetical protein